MVAYSDNEAMMLEALPTVLVIDDERGPRESLRILLNPNYRVFCADSVDAGVALLQEHHPDTVVMDIRMPGKSGIEGLRMIREIDGDVSVIMFTGFGALETAQEAMRLGANDYVKKPFDAFELRKVIHRHVLRTQRERGRKEAAGELMRMNQTLKAELDRRVSLASLGQKSAELVHDLRSPLTVILGYVDLLSEQIRQQGSGVSLDGEETASYLDSIEKSVLRCRDMAEMWLDVSKGKLRRSPTDLGQLIRSITGECGVKAEERRVELDADPCETRVVVEIDAMQIERAIQNLIVNAVDAVSPGTGKVRVWCSLQGESVEIGVEDNGCGMSEELIRLTAEPFFTTKKNSGGTGLGLSIVRQVTEAHGGAVRIQSKPGEGTRITMTIPSRHG
ncbi:MAG: hybrid sensor histidine kinase/response regulator [bacterium]